MNAQQLRSRVMGCKCSRITLILSPRSAVNAGHGRRPQLAAHRGGCQCVPHVRTMLCTVFP